MLCAVLAVLALAPTAGTAGLEDLLEPWPRSDAISGIEGRDFSYPTLNPFTLNDVGVRSAQSGFKPALAAPGPYAQSILFLPDEASAETPVPAVVILHGAGGVLAARELTYARQFAHIGMAALVIDVFASRRHLGGGFQERLMNVTESMAVADAYGGLRQLAAMPEIDPARIALMGFSYGGMATLIAAHAQVSERYQEAFALDGDTGAEPLRFRAYVSFYAPCIAHFEDERSVGAPVLIMWGTEDALIDKARCNEIADSLRNGGSEVMVLEFADAHHQWDGGRQVAWRAPRGLAACEFRVKRSGTVLGKLNGTPFSLPMINPLTRKMILALCSDREGYIIEADASVRKQSNRALGAFLWRALH